MVNRLADVGLANDNVLVCTICALVPILVSKNHTGVVFPLKAWKRSCHGVQLMQQNPNVVFEIIACFAHTLSVPSNVHCLAEDGVCWIHCMSDSETLDKGNVVMASFLFAILCVSVAQKAAID